MKRKTDQRDNLQTQLEDIQALRAFSINLAETGNLAFECQDRALWESWDNLLSFLAGCCVIASTPEARNIRAATKAFQDAANSVETAFGDPFLMVVYELVPRDGVTLPELLLDTPRSDVLDVRVVIVPADIDQDGDQFTAIIGRQRMPLDPRAVPERVRAAVRRRADRLDSDRQTMAPTAAIEVMQGARPRSMTEADRIEMLRDSVKIEPIHEPGGIVTAIRGHQIRVELDADSRILAAETRPSRRKWPAVQAVLPYEATEGSPDELAEMALQTLAAFDTDAKLTLMAMLSMAERTGNLIVENISEMQRLRGIPGNAGRQRLHRHFELFTRVQFEVSQSDKPDHYQRIPLLQYDRIIGIRGNAEARVYQIHRELWDRMQQRGHAIVWDDAILAANTRDHEWQIRLYWDLVARWSRGWVMHRMDRTGGQMQLTMGAVLQSAGLLDAVLAFTKKNGAPATRRRHRETLEVLQRFPARDGRFARLVGDFEIEERGRDPLDDMLTVTAAPATANLLTEFRAPAFRNAEKRAAIEASGKAAKPAKSGRRRPKRQRS